MTHHSPAALIAATLILLASPVLAKSGAEGCAEPGDILELPTPGYLKDGEPNLFLVFDTETIPVTPLSVTSSRMQIRLPALGLPYDARFFVVHEADGEPQRKLGNGQTCVLEQGLTRPPVPLDRPTKNDVVAPSGSPEYVIVGKARDIAKAEGVIVQAGATVLRTKQLANLGSAIAAVDLNGAISLSQLRSELAKNSVSVTVDRHTVYASADGGRVYAPAMIGMQAGSPCRLSRPIRIGLIDGPVDETNPALSGVSILTNSVLSAAERQGSTDHATGIAALIASQGQSDSPTGLAPGSQIFSVVAFAKTGGRDVAKLENIALAMDWLIESNVPIVNMSLAGPRNDTLEKIIEIADNKGIIMVAATGNAALGEVAFPASDPRVIGITAIDANKKLYRKANYGDAVDFAAPGVDVLVANKSGSGYRSGTSYASAVATAVIAQQLANGASTREGVIAALKGRAEDLGDAGWDSRFGWGLIQANGC